MCSVYTRWQKYRETKAVLIKCDRYKIDIKLVERYQLHICLQLRKNILEKRLFKMSEHFSEENSLRCCLCDYTGLSDYDLVTISLFDKISN